MKGLKGLGVGLLVGLGMVLLNTGWGWAATLYVDPVNGPYTTIQAAVNAAVTGDEIVVLPGTYNEGVDVNKLVYIRSEKGPEVTKIISSGEYGVKFTSGGNEASLSGFYIKAISYGVYIDATSSSNNCENMEIKNNIIEACGSHGIYFNCYGAYSHIYYCRVENNTISGNGNNGIYLYSSGHSSSGYIRYCEISNNIIINNGKFGVVEAASKVLDNNYYNNDIFNNTDGPSNGVTISESDGNMFVDPKLIDPETGNYMLQAGSPCIDAGRKGVAFLDPDGTRNNMGVYGGPGAASFWPYPEGGPVVTDLSVTPASVPQGGTIRIQATGSVR